MNGMSESDHSSLFLEQENKKANSHLSSVDMGHDSNVSVQIQIDFTLLGRGGEFLVDVLGLRGHGQRRTSRL